MNALKLHVDVDEAVANAVPALRPLVGKRVELIVLETPEPTHRSKSLDDLVPIKPPPGVGPVSVEDMKRAIVEEAVRRAGF